MRQWQHQISNSLDFVYGAKNDWNMVPNYKNYSLTGLTLHSHEKNGMPTKLIKLTGQTVTNTRGIQNQQRSKVRLIIHPH